MELKYYQNHIVYIYIYNLYYELYREALGFISILVATISFSLRSVNSFN